MRKRVFNPGDAELFVFIFQPFETRIANAISSFKWRKHATIYGK